MSAKHNCRDHVVIRHGANGGKPVYRCGKCKRPLTLRLRPEQVLQVRV